MMLKCAVDGKLPIQILPHPAPLNPDSLNLLYMCSGRNHLKNLKLLKAVTPNRRFIVLSSGFSGFCALLDLYKMPHNGITLLGGPEKNAPGLDISNTFSNIERAGINLDGSLVLTIKDNNHVDSLLEGDITVRLHDVTTRESIVLQHGCATGRKGRLYEWQPEIICCGFSPDGTSFFLCKHYNTIEFYDFAQLAVGLTLYQLHCIITYDTAPSFENRHKVVAMRNELSLETWIPICLYFNTKYRNYPDLPPLGLLWFSQFLEK